MNLIRSIAVVFACLWTTSAHAFCGFYVADGNQKLFNNATQVVLMREGTKTVLSMQNNYKGPPSNFAMVIPVPVVLKKENVKTLDKALFDRIDTFDAPRLVEYWEQDPCQKNNHDPRIQIPSATGAKNKGGGGGGGEPKDYGVKIEAQFTVGEYEIVILSAQDSSGLDSWLRDNKYNIPEGAEPALKPYIESGMKFFVAKVDTTKVTFDAEENALLSPLRFSYDAESFALPVRLGLLNSSGEQDIIVHLLGPSRYEVSNYKTVTIPTNLTVSKTVKESFASFYASLFDATIEKNPGAVVTEYAWEIPAATTTNGGRGMKACDPCPPPAALLTQQDLLSLGADQFLSTKLETNTLYSYEYVGKDCHQDDIFFESKKRPTKKQSVGPGCQEKKVPYQQASTTTARYVLTRLHARYKKDGLGEDLIFAAASPIVGGREEGSADALNTGALPSSTNQFQGRYIIRHAWEGAITCEEPQRGRWGAPPRGGSNAMSSAKNLASVKRGEKLSALVMQDITALSLKADIIQQIPTPKMVTPSATTSSTNNEPKAATSKTEPAPAEKPRYEIWAMIGVGVLLALYLSLKKK